MHAVIWFQRKPVNIYNITLQTNCVRCKEGFKELQRLIFKKVKKTITTEARIKPYADDGNNMYDA